MIRVGLYSGDRTLQPLLSSALEKDFEILLAADAEEISRLASSAECEVMILDLSSNHDALQERIECCQRIITSPIPSLVMADDSLRSAAMELVRLGAFAYCRKPPSVRDLRILLHRAYENSALKQELHKIGRAHV